VTDLVPSEIACFESSPGRIRRTAVWISREEIVDFLEYAANSDFLVRSISNYQVKQPTRGFSGNTLENIIDEGVQDGHCFVGDTGVRMYLLQH
jgi:hypothetical protein